LNQDNKEPYDHRYFSWLIKRLKKGIIVAIIFGSIFMISEAVIVIHLNWTNIAYQDAQKMADEDRITYSELDDIENQLEYVHYYVEYVCSIVSTLAHIGLNIAFIFIIIGFLSITIDKSIDKKMQRICLILAGFALFFLMFIIFMSVTGDIWLYYPYYR